MSIAKPTFDPRMINVQITTLERPIIEPIDKSIPPEMSKRAMAIVAMPRTVIC